MVSSNFAYVAKVSAYHHTLNANHCLYLWEILAIIGVKSNITTFSYFCRFIVNMFYCGRILLSRFNPADIIGVRLCITSTVSLDNGHCEATMHIVKGHQVIKRHQVT